MKIFYSFLDSYPTLSLVYPLFFELWTGVVKWKKTTKRREIAAFCELLHQDLGVRWLEGVKHEHLIASYLDPRFKGLSFLSDYKVRRTVRELVATKIALLNPQDIPVPPPAVPTQEAGLSELEKRLNSQPEEAVSDEMLQYDGLPKLHIKGNPLLWWRDNERKFPRLGSSTLIYSLCSSAREAVPVYCWILCSVRETILASWQYRQQAQSISKFRNG